MDVRYIAWISSKASISPAMTRDVPLLPVIATLSLLNKDLPTTAGMFKWRSNVYMIGRQTLPRVLNKDTRQGVSLYRALCESNKVKATSRLIHGVSLDDSKTILSHSESNILQLRKPKIRPIGEEFSGEIHMIDSLPSLLACRREYTWTGSHEVFNRDNGCWIEEVDETFPILSYLVVGNKIYAKASDCRHLVFDSRRKKWHASSKCCDGTRAHAQKAMSSVVWEDGKPCVLPKDLWCILERSLVASSVGGFPYGDVQDPLYVVIALMVDSGISFRYGEHAVAFLVNSSGQVLCIQSLKRLFKGIGVREGKIIKVEEDKLWGRRRQCAPLLPGVNWGGVSATKVGVVLINTLDVEELADVADKVREVLAKGSEAWPVEM